jgi:hypothetical protein
MVRLYMQSRQFILSVIAERGSDLEGRARQGDEALLGSKFKAETHFPEPGFSALMVFAASQKYDKSLNHTKDDKVASETTV